MAHYEKFKATAVGHILNHMDDYKTRVARDNVDSNLISTNIDFLSDNEETAFERYKRLLNQDNLRIIKRENINTLCSCIITIPEDFIGDEELFFKECFNFLCDKHGAENCVSAVVHRDEPKSKSHLHFCFCPIIPDKKRMGSLKLSAKEVIDKKFLNGFHPELKKHLEEKLGVPCSVLNGATAGGNKTIEELKANVLKQENKHLSKKISHKTKVLSEINKEIVEKEDSIELKAKELFEVQEDIEQFLKTDMGQDYLSIKEKESLKKEVKEHRDVINTIWSQYKDENKAYWELYHQKKKELKTALMTSRINDSKNQNEISKQLYMLYQYNESFISKLFRICILLALYLKEPYLKQQVSELEEINRELKETARIVVKESVATAEALHTKKIELIENQMHEWEEALKTAESNIEIATQNLYTKTRDNRYQIR